MSATAMIQEPLLQRVPRLVKRVREVVDPIIDLPPPHELSTITVMLSSVPLGVCLELCTLWEAVQICHTNDELDEVVSTEDRMLIEMVQAMYDHRRSCTVKRDTIIENDTRHDGQLG
jgi:hypothetical protein